VIEIERVGKEGEKRSALVIDGSMFRDLSAGKGRTFTHESLPFDLMITNWKRHAEPKRDTTGTRSDAVDGYFIQELSLLDPNTKQAIADEALFSACIAIARDKKTGAEQKGILWEVAAAPWTVTSGDQKFVINLAHRTYRLPFAIRLDQTEEEKHPGTDRARKFFSKVTKISGGHEEKRLVTMNEPVRSEGYAVFQQTFDDGVESGSGVKRSGFQIVENPADHWPLISCIIVGFGLLIHFSMSLARAMKWNEWITAGSTTVVVAIFFGLAIWKLW